MHLHQVVANKSTNIHRIIAPYNIETTDHVIYNKVKKPCQEKSNKIRTNSMKVYAIFLNEIC